MRRLVFVLTKIFGDIDKYVFSFMDIFIYPKYFLRKWQKETSWFWVDSLCVSVNLILRRWSRTLDYVEIYVMIIMITCVRVELTKKKGLSNRQTYCLVDESWRLSVRNKACLVWCMTILFIVFNLVWFYIQELFCYYLCFIRHCIRKLLIESLKLPDIIVQMKQQVVHVKKKLLLIK